MKSILSILTLCFVLFSCTPEGEIFNENKELSPELTWEKTDTKTFNVPIQDKSKAYDMSILFRYAQGYPFKIMNIKVLETSPSGKKQEYRYTLKVREDNGDYIGEPSLDIWDSTHEVEKKKKFEEEGTYVYEISHDMKKNPVQMVMEIGMNFTEAK